MLMSTKGSLKKESPIKLMLKHSGVQKDFVRMLNRRTVMEDSLKKSKSNLFFKVMTYNREREKANQQDYKYCFTEANNKGIIEEVEKQKNTQK